MPSYGSTIIVTKQLAAASANNIALTQTPTSGTPFTLNGSLVNAAGVAILDTQRRIIITAGSEASTRTVVLTGTNSQGAPISETVTITASAAAAYASLYDYATLISALPLGGGWTAAATIGTNTVGATQPQILSHYQAIFTCGVEVDVSGTASCHIECTRDIPFALPNIYTAGMTFMQPLVNWFTWPTLATITTETASDIDSPVNALRLVVDSGQGSCTARIVPVGLRT